MKKISIIDLLKIVRRHGIEISETEEQAILAAFSTRGPYKGYLCKTKPNSSKLDGLAAAAWLGIQPNPFKIGIGSVLFLDGPARELHDKLSRFKWPGYLDKDREALVGMGVW